MKVRLGHLRQFIHEALDCWGGTRPEETYDECLADDPTFHKHSVLVPDDVKDALLAWMKIMGLSQRKKKLRR